MRLLLIMPNIISYRSFHAELGAELCAAGAEVHVACSSNQISAPKAKVSAVAAVPEHKGLTIHAIDFARGLNLIGHLRAARRLAALVDELKPDIVHTHFDAAIFTTAIARNSRWPTLLATFHGLSYPTFHGWRKTLIRTATLWAIRHFNTVFVLNVENRDILRAAAPRADVRMFESAGVGCDIQRFAPPSPEERETMRASLKFSADHCVLIYVGRFIEVKGFAMTARAFLKLAERNPNVRLLVVGESDALHPTGLTSEEEEAFKKSPQIVAVGRRPDVERYLAAADVLMLPSYREGVPVCLMEALAVGVPVVTRDACGCRDVVRDKVDGTVLRECTVETNAAEMKRLADSPELRREMSLQALAGRDRFDRRHFVREQKEIYEAIMRQKSRVPNE